MRYRDPNVEHTQVTFKLRVAPNAYEIQVSDNGLGISEDSMIGFSVRAMQFLLFHGGTLGESISTFRSLN